MTNNFSVKISKRRFSLHHLLVLCAALFVVCGTMSRAAMAANDEKRTDIAAQAAEGRSTSPPKTDSHGDTKHGDSHGDKHGGEHTPGTFDAHAGTWLNGVARTIFGEETPRVTYDKKTGEKHISNPGSIKYDYIVVGFLIMGALALTGTIAARKVRIRPEGKGHSLPNAFEAAVEGFQNYIVGVMGRDLARKYTPLIASFFFSILFFNWMGLVPGMIAPTANPNTTIALAIVAFVATHFIAIKEVGFKAWAMHFVGEPTWLFWLNIPLHIMGELVKPIALAIRLLCNVFGEEMVIYKLATMAVAAMVVLKFPIPFQFPIMMLGVLFGFLQALVFSTLLAIYISTMSTHHDDHDAHNAHGHVEHDTVNGHHEVVGRSNQATLA